MSFRMDVIARAHSPFKQKFGVPRQSGLVPQVRTRIVFEADFANPDAVRGLEGFSHAWLVWVFSETPAQDFHPTVRPPRLEGERVGVWATRSPHRPNRIGLSSVSIEEIEENGTLVVGGADLVDGTPIIDIKPYVATDLRPDARWGFQERNRDYQVEVDIPAEWEAMIPATERAALRAVLAQDPRPHFHHDPERVYHLSFGEHEVSFVVHDQVLRVVDIRARAE